MYVNGKGFEIYGDTLSLQDIKQELKHPTDDRASIMHALWDDEVDVVSRYELTKIDNWFLMKLFNIILSNHLNLNSEVI